MDATLALAELYYYGHGGVFAKSCAIGSRYFKKYVDVCIKDDALARGRASFEEDKVKGVFIAVYMYTYMYKCIYCMCSCTPKEKRKRSCSPVLSLCPVFFVNYGVIMMPMREVTQIGAVRVLTVVVSCFDETRV